MTYILAACIAVCIVIALDLDAMAAILYYRIRDKFQK